ncbi:TetR/AcrR family transcriptional regulator [Yinghuangia seranimata]|uniref:TetR/AcrR family transcriptional regulator n=1 Tax=Yinghuangia seranimata TaxID=408067 RepID=UPI00248BFC4B|nr:TetR family transcriptional regulator [Yinghuangia seranimata]MDI2132022.1 TetR family transcriptional regulator [Yinghuangia seranimata]
MRDEDDTTGEARHQGAAAGRRVQLLDAAIRVLAAQGLRGLTHRAVQQEAGLPHGSVTYYFKTRDHLVLGVIERMSELEQAAASQVADELMRAMVARPFDPDYRHIADLTKAWWDGSRDRELARYEMQIAGRREALIGDAMRRSTAEFRKLTEFIALACGSTDAEADGEVLIAMIDGMLFHYLVNQPADPRYIEIGLRRAIESLRSVPAEAANRT